MKTLKQIMLTVSCLSVLVGAPSCCWHKKDKGERTEKKHTKKHTGHKKNKRYGKED